MILPGYKNRTEVKALYSLNEPLIINPKQGKIDVFHYSFSNNLES